MSRPYYKQDPITGGGGAQYIGAEFKLNDPWEEQAHNVIARQKSHLFCHTIHTAKVTSISHRYTHIINLASKIVYQLVLHRLTHGDIQWPLKY